MLLWITLISATAVPENDVQIYLPFPYSILVSLASYASIPLIGWLADAKVGNYKLYRAGTIFLLIAIISSVATLQILHYVSSTVNIVLSTITSLLQFVGMATCLITALQLGLDQMPDASADNITSFIAWCVCSIFAGLWMTSTLLNTIERCISISSGDDLFEIAQYVKAPVCITIVCCTVFVFTPRCLVVELKSSKALKTIYQVLKFAAKHKAPLNRSAFTFWEEKIPSRLDLGKLRYGGPFTTEQMEDVKTFFKILIIFIPVFIIYSPSLTYYVTLTHSDCSSVLYGTLTTDTMWSVIVSTIVYELGIYPFIRNWIPTSLKRIAIGSFLALLIKISFLVESTVNLNSTQPATAYDTDNNLLHNVNAVLGFLQYLAILILINGLLEFVCAQSPYNMRGLLTGCAAFIIFASMQVGGLITIVINTLIPFYDDIISRAILVVLNLIGFILHCVLAHWYKRRVRDEDYPVHRVVEEVYDRYLSHVH